MAFPERLGTPHIQYYGLKLGNAQNKDKHLTMNRIPPNCSHILRVHAAIERFLQKKIVGIQDKYLYAKE